MESHRYLRHPDCRCYQPFPTSPTFNPPVGECARRPEDLTNIGASADAPGSPQTPNVVNMVDELAKGKRASGASGRLSLWQIVRSVGPPLLVAILLICFGAINTYRDRSGQGLIELFAGLAIVLAIGSSRFLFGHEAGMGEQTPDAGLGLLLPQSRKPWFARTRRPADWIPPTWPELLRIEVFIVLIGSICVLISLNQILYIGSSNHEFFPYIGAWLLLLVGIFVWTLVPIGIFNKIRWHVNHSNEQPEE